MRAGILNHNQHRSRGAPLHRVRPIMTGETHPDAVIARVLVPVGVKGICASGRARIDCYCPACAGFIVRKLGLPDWVKTQRYGHGVCQLRSPPRSHRRGHDRRVSLINYNRVTIGKTNPGFDWLSIYVCWMRPLNPYVVSCIADDI